MMNQPHQTTDDEVLALPGFDDDDDDDLLDTRPTGRARSKGGSRRRWLIAISIVLVVLILGGLLLAIRAGRAGGFSYTTQQVQPGTLSLTVNATGPMQGNIYNVDFSGSGTLAAIDVSIGQQVKKGQTLAKLSVTSLQDAVNQAQAALNAAENTLGAADNSLGSAEASGASAISVAYDQEQNALNVCNSNPSPPPRCVQLAEDQYAQAQRQADAQSATAQAQVASAYGQLQAAEAQLRTAQDNLNNATLIAPHAGVVATINGSVGGAPGAPNATGSAAAGGNTFIQIVDLSSLQLYADVNEADIAGIQDGQSVDFSVSAYGSRQFTGTVKAISPLGQTVSNVVTYTVIIQVDMQSLNGARLLPGMTANATITTVTRPDVLLVPASAVNFAQSAAVSGATTVPSSAITPGEVQSALAQARQMVQNLESGNSSITQDNPTPSYVLENVNKRLIVKPVVLGLTDGTSYEVLAGLSSGDSVVTASQQVKRGIFGGAGGVLSGLKG